MLFRYLLVAIISGSAVFLFLNQNDNEKINIEENIEENIVNECIDPDNLEYIRNSIIDDAAYKLERDLKVSSGIPDFGYYNVHSLSDVYNTKIEFENIRKPLYDDAGDIKCRAKLRVTYLGNDSSQKDLLKTFRYYASVNYDDFTFYDHPVDFFNSLEVNSYNIDDAEIRENNEFSVQGSYYISQVYNMDGTLGVAYSYDFDLVRDMLAGIVAIDAVKQKRAIVKRRRSIEEKRKN